MTCKKEYKLIAVFVVTAIWDVLLRMFSEQKIEFMGIETVNWVIALRPYFKHHTILSAALIAGFVGAVTSALIDYTIPKYFNTSYTSYLTWVAFMSAIVGIPMRYSGLFPHLKKHYYDPLPVTTVFSDALSGVIVALTIWIGVATKNQLA